MGGVSQYDQSTCGNATPYPSAAAGTAINSCQTGLANGTYHLTSNIGSDQTADCLTWGGGSIVIDLAGFTVTGKIESLNWGPSLGGTHIYSSAASGSVVCNTDSGTIACINLPDDGYPLSAPVEIDHLTITDNGTSSTVGGKKALFIEENPSSSTLGTAFGVKLHHLTTTPATGLTNSRISNLWVNGNSLVHLEVNNNKTTCWSTSAACQGMATYQVGDTKYHNNWAINQLQNSGSSETPRAVDCDGNLPNGSEGCEVYNNYFDAQDGRAWRFRNVTNVTGVTTAHDNLVDNIVHGSTGSYAAAVHICDPDSGTNDGTPYVFSNNTFNTSDGTVLLSRGCTNFPKFQNNVVVCLSTCSGLLARIAQPISGSSTTFQLTNNSGPNNTAIPLTSNPQTNVESGATAQVCKTGTVGGSGTITQVGC